MKQRVFELFRPDVYLNVRRILVCGSRWLGDSWYDVVHDELMQTHPSSIIIHGGARGADTLAGEVALTIGRTVRVFEADWQRWGRAAGPLRNSQMLRSDIELVVAFWDHVSKGTLDTIMKARQIGIPVRVIGVDR